MRCEKMDQDNEKYEAEKVGSSFRMPSVFINTIAATKLVGHPYLTQLLLYDDMARRFQPASLTMHPMSILALPV
jgi:hypothetical protein